MKRRRLTQTRKMPLLLFEQSTSLLEIVELHAVFSIRDVGFFQVVSALNFLGILTSLIP